MKNLKDKIIKCKNCQQEFAWTAEEQQFYTQKNLNSPKHCPICQAALNAAKQDQFRGRIKR